MKLARAKAAPSKLPAALPKREAKAAPSKPPAALPKLIEVEPGRWRIDKPRPKAARSNLPLPYVISDSMPPTEQVDGKFYTSKRAFRAVGRALGLTEVGNEKPKPRQRASTTTAAKQARRHSIKTAFDKLRSS